MPNDEEPPDDDVAQREDDMQHLPMPHPDQRVEISPVSSLWVDPPTVDLSRAQWRRQRRQRKAWITGAAIGTLTVASLAVGLLTHGNDGRVATRQVSETTALGATGVGTRTTPGPAAGKQTSAETTSFDAEVEAMMAALAQETTQAQANADRMAAESAVNYLSGPRVSGAAASGPGAPGTPGAGAGVTGGPTARQSAPPQPAGQAPAPPAVPTKQPAPRPAPAVKPGAQVDLSHPTKKRIANSIVSSAENSSLNTAAQYQYIEDIRDGCGYTAGIVGFCTATGDLLVVVKKYANLKPGNILAKYIPALEILQHGNPSHDGLDPTFVADWKLAAKDPTFIAAQDAERDRIYFNPALAMAKADGLSVLGQFIYYDAIVKNGSGTSARSMRGIRSRAMARAQTPAAGGDESVYLHAFLDEAKANMQARHPKNSVDRIEKCARKFLNERNFQLAPPLVWTMYGDTFRIDR